MTAVLTAHERLGITAALDCRTEPSQRATERLGPSTVGWLNVEDPFAFDHEPSLAWKGRRFTSATEESAGIAGLGATVGLPHGLDRQRAEDRVLDRAGC
ncbi:hypothetical protein ACI79G_23295 [Geodermatophilus sp. SYSU D00779]